MTAPAEALYTPSFQTLELSDSEMTDGVLPREIIVDGVTHITDSLLSGLEIEERVGQLGAELGESYADRGEVHALTVMNGAFHFASDLRRSMQRANPALRVTSDHVKLTSYNGTQSSGVIRRQKDELPNVKNRHVLVIEDVLETGFTLNWLLGCLEQQDPASLEVVVALEKGDIDHGSDILNATKVHTGFKIGKDFVVGYGLDLKGQYRDLDGIYTLTPAVV